ncbi:SHOCT domain-containing protein [Streptomyces sp. 4.24]|uniref:SHOCT domain-containing protein n=1 Tax=Streptomyces tritrimontium TaxID=3406573 RepID=UPI003BB773A1
MFIRPIGSVVNPSQRPSGRPLLRGILARGAYVWDAGRQQAARSGHEADGGAADSGASGAAAGSSGAAGREPWTGAAPAARTAPAASREPADGRAEERADGRADRPEAAGGDLTDRLTRLAALAREGLLTPEEFTAAKARLLSD